MIKYIYTVLEDTLMVSTLAVMMMVWAKVCMGNRSVRFTQIGIIAGLIGSAIVTVITNTSRIMTRYHSVWNMWLCFFIIVAGLLFIIFALASTKSREKGFASWLADVFGALFIAMIFIYDIPSAMGYPFNFDTNEKGIISAEFGTRFLGWLLGLLILYIFLRNFYRIAVTLASTALSRGLLCVGTFAFMIRCLAPMMTPWVTRKKHNMPSFLPEYSREKFPWAFGIVQFITNYILLFMLIIAGMTLIVAVVLYIRERKIHDPYSNVAQLRRLKAIEKRNRRRCWTVLGSFVVIVLMLTAAKAYDTKAVVLSEPETYTVSDDGTKIYVDLADVEDGHLHRFEYTSDNNVNIRWIIIKKPNSAAYGVGLDACDICGDAGYYERNGQVVCKRCDVVMNINTIGFEGGCNPIPLAYTIDNGQMVFNVDDILAGEVDFK